MNKVNLRLIGWQWKAYLRHFLPFLGLQVKKAKDVDDDHITY
ncbi:MAG: hypothetical protein ACI94Z_002663 [Yoonia sp.]